MHTLLKCICSWPQYEDNLIIGIMTAPTRTVCVKFTSMHEVCEKIGLYYVLVGVEEFIDVCIPRLLDEFIFCSCLQIPSN